MLLQLPASLELVASHSSGMSRVGLGMWLACANSRANIKNVFCKALAL